MLDTMITAIDKSLEALLRTEVDFPGYSLDLCSGYVSTDGVVLLKRMLKKAPRVRAVVGLNLTNRVSAFQMLRDDCGVEVYVTITRQYTLFHPKIYLGTLSASAWAMVGSSNLTNSGLSTNVEQNLFVTGQRHTEPFLSIEAQIAAFIQQAYLFNADIEKVLAKIEQQRQSITSEVEYKKRLYAYGIKPKTRLEYAIPSEARQVAIDTLFEFAEKTKLEYAYQMLLLLIILKRIDENGHISLEDAALCFAEFYKSRRDAGLVVEKSYASKRAIVDNPDVRQAQIIQMLKTSPFPRFERQGLLDMSEDGKYFIINLALLEALTPSLTQQLRSLAMKRIAQHFGDDDTLIEAMIVKAIG
ncbi:MAG TPA: phospholipase D-like domain-containing protein [Ktedonobacteraceae bacterium]|nr:phospholipase D-like domain-containing protein [Ktedonobacteraceae bacterium]